MAEKDMLIEPYKDSATIRDLITELPPLAREAKWTVHIQGSMQDMER